MIAHQKRVAELRTRLAFSAFFCDNALNNFVARCGEWKALRSWQASLAALGEDSSIETAIRSHLATV